MFLLIKRTLNDCRILRGWTISQRIYFNSLKITFYKNLKPKKPWFLKIKNTQINSMVTVIILLLVSASVLFMGVFQIIQINKIAKTGSKVKGIIFALEQSGATSTINATYPIVRFVTNHNEWITVASKTGLVPGIYKKGTDVNIIYNKEQPMECIIDDKYTYVVPIIMLIVSAALLTYGIILIIKI